MTYLRIKNWTKHQHYKDRRPPWIKLHNSLFDDYEFNLLQDASKLQLIAIWLLASCSTTTHVDGDPMVPEDEAYLTKRAGLSSKIDLKPLIDAGFLIRYQHASNVIATCYSETETETYTKTETNKETTRNILPETDNVVVVPSSKRTIFQELDRLMPGRVNSTAQQEVQYLIDDFGVDAVEECVQYMLTIQEPISAPLKYLRGILCNKNNKASISKLNYDPTIPDNMPGGKNRPRI